MSVLEHSHIILFYITHWRLVISKSVSKQRLLLKDLNWIKEDAAENQYHRPPSNLEQDESEESSVKPKSSSKSEDFEPLCISNGEPNYNLDESRRSDLLGYLVNNNDEEE